MTFPIDLQIGSLKVDSHFLAETLAFFVGFRYFLFLRKRSGDTIAAENRVMITVAAAFGALLGSRLLGILDHPGILAENAGNFYFYFSAKTIVGGLLGGLVTTEIAKKLLKVEYSSGDLIAFPIMLAMMIGRIGCFLSGLEDATYGVASNLPWAVDLGDGIRRHPTALYEFAFLGLTWMGIWFLSTRRRLADGAKFKLFLASYLLFRLAIEIIKPVYIWPIGLSTIQIAALLGILYYWKVFLRPQSLFAKIQIQNP